jgi:Reverse transcriptase (RNA-dependent DNA polymerase)
MYGDPCILPKGGIVVRLLWNYIVKDEGKRRSRNCCDGSKRAATRLHNLVNTYSSCIGIPIYRLFSALSTALGYTQYGGDARDAYTHSPPPSVPCFARIDDAYAKWYLNRFGIVLDKNLVLPIQHALQGHPEAGVLWENHINNILTSKEFNFKSTRHEPNIYVGYFSGKKVLMRRQVDDFSVACDDPKIAEKIFDMIGITLKLPSETSIPFAKQGIISKYNGIDVLQSRDYVKLSCESYIDKLLVAHGWEVPRRTDECTLSKHFEPLPQNVIPQLYNDIGPPEYTKAHSDLESSMKFSYRALLGELLYAFVISRPDIGYVLAT